MGDEIEAAGAMATASLAAGAIEGRDPAQAGEGACLNCGAALGGRYCANCGQAAHAHRSLGHMFEEFLHGVLHFDTKAWRTLPMLIGRPGTLTRNYIYGKRARYISPLALFLFTVFFMFFVFAFAGENDEFVNVSQSMTQDEATIAIAQMRANLEDARADNDTAEVERLEPVLEELERALAAATETGEAQRVRMRDWRDGLREAAADENFEIVSGAPKINEKLRAAFSNPDLYLYKMQQAAYKFSFLLVPISLPFIALVFLWKRGLTLYDHTVFSLYGLAFAALVFVIIDATDGVPWLEWVGAPLLFGAIPAHMFFHLKGAYALGWWSALWRTLLLLVFSIVALLIFLAVIVVLGLAG